MTVARLVAVPLTQASILSAALATSHRDVGPLADFDELPIEPMRGDSPGLPSNPGVRVFGTDFARVRRLEAEIKAAVAAHLRQGGLRVVESSDNLVRFNLFGGTFAPAECPSRTFFMLQVEVCLPTEPTCSQERTILGVVDDGQVEQAVVDAAIEATDECVEQRAAYRGSKKEN